MAMRDWTRSVLEDEREAAMTPGERDRQLLGRVLAQELTGEQREAFADMLAGLVEGRRSQLSANQRGWARGVLDAHAPEYENLVSSGRVPRGREVEVPAALRDLPKRPPSRPKLGDE
jgi:hypothetical protein